MSSHAKMASTQFPWLSELSTTAQKAALLLHWIKLNPSSIPVKRLTTYLFGFHESDQMGARVACGRSTFTFSSPACTHSSHVSETASQNHHIIMSAHNFLFRFFVLVWVCSGKKKMLSKIDKLDTLLIKDMRSSSLSHIRKTKRPTPLPPRTCTCILMSTIVWKQIPFCSCWPLKSDGKPKQQ